MTKLSVEQFQKSKFNFNVELRAGIDDDPPSSSNVIFYLQMKSTTNEGTIKTEPIWLSLADMVKLSMLMTTASHFWIEKLDKGSQETKERIKLFRDSWKRMSESIDKLNLGK